MSNKQQTLLVIPPISEKHLNGEHFKYTGFDCPTCNGTGVVPIHSDFLGLEPDDTETCQRCQGHKKLCVHIVAKWSPDEIIIE